MSDVADLERLIATRVSLVVIRTNDIDQVEALVAEVARRQGRKAEVWTLSRGLVPLGVADAPKRRWPDIPVASRELGGWKAKTALETGLQGTIAWFKAEMGRSMEGKQK